MRFIEQMDDDQVYVNLEFSKAFSSLSRVVMLSTVDSHVPDMYLYCHLAYGKPSVLKLGEFSITFVLFTTAATVNAPEISTSLWRF